MIRAGNMEFTEENFLVLQKRVDELSLRNTHLKKMFSDLQSKYQLTQDELEYLKRQLFGRKSERFMPQDPGQLKLELEQMAEAMQEQQATEKIEYERKKAQTENKPGHGRMPLPAHLRREQTIIEPENLPAGSKKIGEEITEVLEYKKAEIYVKKYVRPKYALPNQEGIKVADLPSMPIPKGNAGPGLLSHILISKYTDHLPLYRQVQQFKRLGIDISDKTMGGWVAGSCDLLTPLYEKLMAVVQQSDYLQADETPIKVLDKDKKGDTHKGYYWVYSSPVDKAVCFQYRKGRGREGPKEFLKDFQGAIQADGWQVYDKFEKRKGIRLLGCMAHARRKFDESLDNDEYRARYVLTEIQELYKIERQARKEGLGYEARKAMRLERSLPVMKRLKEWLLENAPGTGSKVLPQSKIGKAISYTLGMWHRLERYFEDGRYEIDNNWVENSIRPVALGRKNYLFAGSHDAAQRAAMIYSFLGSCKKNNVEPSEWLTDVLSRIQDHPINKIEKLLPEKWIKKSPVKDS
jgi:transposase